MVGRWSVYRNINLLNVGQVVIEEEAMLGGFVVTNNNAAVVYLKLYDMVTAPGITDTPKMTIGLRASTFRAVNFPEGISFEVGIGVRACTGVADNDNTAPNANDVVLNLLYR